MRDGKLSHEKWGVMAKLFAIGNHAFNKLIGCGTALGFRVWSHNAGLSISHSHKIRKTKFYFGKR